MAVEQQYLRKLQDKLTSTMSSKIQFAAIVLALTCALALQWALVVAGPSVNVDLSPQVDQPDISSATETPQTRPRPPGLFDFDRYRKLFRKSYSSFTELIVRKKLFFARAFRAFISAIKFNNNASTYYLKINEQSDYTEKEKKAMNNKALMDPSELEKIGLVVEPILDEHTLRTQLELVRARVDGKGRQIYEELERTSGKGNRRRRDVSKRRDVSIADIEGTPDNGQESPEVLAKMKKIVESNNPNYQPAELFSYGADEDNTNEIVDEEYFDAVEHQPVEQTFESIPSFVPAPKQTPHQPDAVYVDHRNSNCFFKPRSQGKCGCCYAFAFVSYVEYLHCIETETLVPFSEQYMIDCGRNRMYGCEGATLEDTGRFVINFGLELGIKYPFRGRQDDCPYPNHTSPEAMGYFKPRVTFAVIDFDEMAVEKALELTPIYTSICTEGDFAEYGGGVHSGRECTRDYTHAILLIGHGREDGIEYWLIRNSHGASFGENGYYRVAKNSLCLLKGGYILADYSSGNPNIALMLQKNSNNDPDVIKNHYMNILKQEMEQEMNEQSKTAM